MKMMMKLRTWMAAMMLAAASVVVAPAAFAGDPQIDAAKERGIVGEQIDGYLGFVTIEGADPSLKRKVDEINAKRRGLYQKLANDAGVTPAQVAMLTGMKQIEKAAPDALVVDTTGSWVRAKDAKLPEE